MNPSAPLQAALTFSIYFGAVVVSLVLIAWLIALYKTYKLAEKEREEFGRRWEKRHGERLPGRRR